MAVDYDSTGVRQEQIRQKVQELGYQLKCSALFLRLLFQPGGQLVQLRPRLVQGPGQLAEHHLNFAQPQELGYQLKCED